MLQSKLGYVRIGQDEMPFAYEYPDRDSYLYLCYLNGYCCIMNGMDKFKSCDADGEEPSAITR